MTELETLLAAVRQASADRTTAIKQCDAAKLLFTRMAGDLSQAVRTLEQADSELLRYLRNEQIAD